METKSSDIELLMIFIFSLLVVFVSFNLLSPIIDFIFSVVNFSAFSVIFETAFDRRPEDQKFIVISFIILVFALIYLVAKMKNRRNEI